MCARPAGSTFTGAPCSSPIPPRPKSGGDTPWQRPDYEAKLADYTAELVSDSERARFIEAVDGMDAISGDKLATINLIVDTGRLEAPDTRGIY